MSETEQKEALTAKPLAWGMLLSDWEELFRELKQPTFRVKQIWDWLYIRKVTSFDRMTNLPGVLREALKDRVDLSAWQAVDSVESEDGVRKLLLQCRDGEKIESVIIPARDRATLCISTQAGCGFRCAFCATGQCGLDRDLEVGEIVGQLIAASAISQQRITNIVFMGMGEPFANYEKVLKSIRIFNDQTGLAIGARRMTISTCGVVPGILRLSEEGLQVELSVSLHAPNDELRNRIMPVNQRWGIKELIGACDQYMRKTNRIITFEYTLVAGVNDTEQHAKELLDLLRPIGGRINLIPLSPVEHFEGKAPTEEACETFVRRLERGRVNVTLRRSKGKGANAACGQLRLNHLKKDL